jgi:hypothetical protein
MLNNMTINHFTFINIKISARYDAWNSASGIFSKVVTIELSHPRDHIE